MIDTRAVGQELQDQVLAAARKGHRRVTNTAKNVTATAQMIRPQLPSLPAIDMSKLPSPEQLAKLAEKQLTQLRDRAPGLIAKLPSAEHFAQVTEKQLTQLRDRAPGLIAKLPDREQLRASAVDFADQVRSAQRQFVGQVRTAAAPLAQQASAAFSQAATSAAKAVPSPGKAGPTAEVTSDGAAANGHAATKATDSKAAAARTARKAHPAQPGRPAAKAKAAQRSSAPKKSKPTAK